MGVRGECDATIITPTTERIIYKQERTGLDAQIIVDRLGANWLADRYLYIMSSSALL